MDPSSPSSPGTPTPSRPTSQHLSPDQPRTLLQEIDHIKLLLARAPPTHHEPITAQVFRHSRTASDHVPHARILHELDSLKRKVKQEKELVRRPSQVDPGAETETEDEGLDEGVDELEVEVEGLRVERVEREGWLESAERRVDGLVAEKEGLRGELEKVKEEVEGLRGENEGLRGEVEGMKGEREELVGLRDSLVEVRAEKEELGREVESVRALLEEARGRVEELEGQNKKADVEHEDEIARLRARVEELESQKEKADVAAREQEDQVARLRAQVEELKGQKEKADVAAKEQEDQVARLRAQIEELKGQKNKADVASREHEDELARLRGQVEESEGQKEKADVAAREQEHQLARLRGQVEELEGQKRKADEASREHEDELARLQGQVEELQTSVKDRDSTISGLEENKEIAGQHIQRLISDHQSREDESQKRIQELQNSHANAQQEADAANSKVKELEKSVQDHDIRRRELVDQIDEHKTRLASAQKDIDLHGQEIGQLLKEHASANARVEELEREKDEQGRKFEGLLAEKEEALVSIKNERQVVLKALEDGHEAEVRKLRGKIEEAKVAHAKELGDVREQQRRDLEEAQASVAEVKKDLEESDAKAKSNVAEVSDRLVEAEKRNEELQRHLEEKEKAHEISLAEVKKSHSSEVEDLHVRRESMVADISARHESAQREIDEIKKTHASKTEGLKSNHASAIAELSTMHQEAQSQLAELKAQHASEIVSLKAFYEQSAGDTSSEHQSAIAGLKEDLAKAQEAMDAATRNSAEQLSRLKAEQEQRVQEASRELEVKDSEMERLREEHRSQLDEVQTAHAISTQDMEQQHQENLREALARANKDREERIKARMQVQYGKAYEENKRLFEDRMADAEKAAAEKTATRDLQHQNELQSLKSKHQAEVDELRQSHDEAKAAADRELDSAKKSHQAELDAISRVHADSSNASTERELEAVRSRHQAELAAVHRGTETAMAQIREESDRDWRHRLAKMEEEHEQALAAALANADDDLDERLRVQSKVHAKQFDQLQESLHGELESLQLQLEEAVELRLSQSQRADSESQKTLAELGEKLRAAEEASLALQARLDVEMSGHAEVQRSLAELRKQRFEEERRTSESRDALQKQIDTLSAEKSALSKRNSAIFLPSSRDLASLADDADGERDAGEEVVRLKRRLALAEEEREQARVAGSQEAEEKSELARQNEFLVKELEALMSARAANAAAAPQRKNSSVQTDAVVGTSDGDDEQYVREQKSDASLSAAAKRLSSSRPVTPATPKQNSVHGVIDGTPQRASFDAYLQQAQAELSELGSVISANEALFARKIQEHFGDLQRAKDSLAAEYDEKFRSLEADKLKMNRDVLAKNAAEFAQERKQLVASYGADHEDSEKQAAAVTSLPSPKRQALRSAEERLVSEYNRRIVKRKSQIALKHAEDYQFLAQDYDRKLAELLGNKQALESDLSVEPSKFERDLDQFEAISAQLETARAQSSPAANNAGGIAAVDYAPKSHLPKRTVSVTPRTSTIPRAVPYPGNRENMDLTGQQHRPRRSFDALRSVSERQAPVRQSSLRPKSPPSASATRHIASNPRPAAEKSPLQVVKSKFSAEEGKEAKVSSPHQALRSVKNKGRSLRNSSRIIVGDWQATNDI